MTVTITSPAEYSGTISFSSQGLTATATASGTIQMTTTSSGWTNTVTYDGTSYTCLTSGTYVMPEESSSGYGTFTEGGVICTEH